MGTPAHMAAAAGACLAAGIATAWGGITLAEGGHSDYTVVLPAAPTPSQEYAATELQHFVAEMTGARVPLRSDAEPLPARAILLGWTRYTSEVLGGEVDWGRLGEDGFRLRTAGPHLVIVGSGVRGTLYGVYELLERYGGCRWYASWHSVIPRLAVWSLPEIDDEQVPAFVMREPFWFDMFRGDFAARCRANGNRMELEARHGGKIRFGAGLFVHTFNRLMPPGEFFAEHPEYYSEIDGARRADHSQLCLTNPDVVRICTERLLEKIRSDPGAKLYSLSQNDWRGNCTCPNCRAIDEREGSPAGSLIAFVNQVAEQVEKEFPDVWIETLAYQYTRTPPRTVRPRHNVVPRLCTIECDFSLPLDVSPYEQNRKFVEDIRGWSAITDKLYVWDYTTNFAHYLGPHPNFGCLQGNVRFFHDNHVVGLFEQGAYQGRHAEFAELRAWVLAKLLWNPQADVEALYRDFFPGYYGAAAPLVRQYFDELQALAAPPEVIVNIWNPPTVALYPEGFFERAAALWDEAEARVRDEPGLLYNVRMGAIPVTYARLLRLARPTVTYRLEGERFVPDTDGGDYGALARDLLARLEEGGNIRVAESMERQTSFLNDARGITQGFATLRIAAEGYGANVCPELGGRICRLRADNGADPVDPAFGIDCIHAQGGYLELPLTPYSGKAEDAATVTLHHAWRHAYSLSRRISLARDGLRLETSFRNDRSDEQAFRPVLRAGLTLGGGAALCYRIAEGPWQTLAVAADQTMAFAGIPGEGLPGRTVTLAAPDTGEALAFDLPDETVERMLLACDVRNRRCLALVLLPSRMVAGGQTLTVACALRPVRIAGVPAVEVAAGHSPVRLTVEDFMVGIGHYGTWGVHAPDPEAEDGSAAKLFGSHYEWCVQWRVDPALFEPGASYTVRMRVKVEKSGVPGKAFWAGVYDTVRRKGFGQIDPDVADVEEGYRWYDVATWTPEAGQYIWIGPGMFKAGDGAASAVKAVYLDRMELIRQQP
ncbi:MAG: DUF4838 domain-containing protein [Lentisphaeria bacterium]|nr:DUF4838 domain-containing protein [Lentisphaeria bacterium]